MENLPQKDEFYKIMLKKQPSILFIVLIMASFSSCKDVVLPKPAGYLTLEYPEAEYVLFKSKNNPFEFDMNSKAIIKGGKENGLTISYPKMKATLYLTYKPVNKNIEKLLRDAQKLTYEHVIKADDILEQPYINPKKKVYGMFYQVNGNAATHSQFYVTDSINHFLTGSVYFYSKPNFDSIMPAASYVKDDMQQLIESIVWK